MRFFRFRQRPVEIIAFMAIFAALDAVLALLAAFFPGSTIFLLLLIPASSALIALLCPGQWIPIFVLSAFGVCMASSAWNFQATLFYVLPSLIVGGLYGFLFRKRTPSSYLLFGVSLLQFLLFTLSLYLLKLIYEVDVFSLLLSAVGKAENDYTSHVFPLFCLAYSLAQMVLTDLFLRLIFTRLRVPSEEASLPRWADYAIALLFGALTFSLVWFAPTLGYFALGCFLYWSIAIAVTAFPYARAYLYFILGGGALLIIMLFALLYSLCPADTGLALAGLFALPLLVCSFLSDRLMKKAPEHRINPQ